MADVRPYHSPRRELSAAATRRDIIDAARRLFARGGYAQVTVADVAREAGTAVKTVYASAGGKAEILREIVHDAVTSSGALETVAQVRGTTDAAAALTLLAHGTRLGNEHHREAIAILYSAMPVDESAEDLWTQGTSVYRTALREVAEHLESLGALKADMTVDQCADLLWFCFGLASWRTLVNDCHWTWEQAEAELAAIAIRLLIST
jgi:AcrR family transcriptional regulator